jgi:hypothetical protein
MAAHAPEQTARLSDALFLGCGLAWGAALLNAVAAADHLSGYTVLFAVTALAQLGWGIALYRSPSRALLVVGVVLSVAFAAREIANPVGGLESLATADELALAMLALTQLRARPSGKIVRGAIMAVALYLILLSSMSLMPGSAEHGVKGSLVSVPRAGFQFLCHPG